MNVAKINLDDFGVAAGTTISSIVVGMDVVAAEAPVPSFTAAGAINSAPKRRHSRAEHDDDCRPGRVDGLGLRLAGSGTPAPDASEEAQTGPSTLPHILSGRERRTASAPCADLGP